MKKWRNFRMILVGLGVMLMAAPAALAAQGQAQFEKEPLAVTAESATAAELHGHDESPSLGTYGTEGVITRDELLPGQIDFISDTAIEVANSRELQDARRLWTETIDFVDQIDYQLTFRQGVDFLEVDEAELGVLLTTRPTNFGIEELGLFLSDEEAAEFQRRLDVGDLAPAIRSELFPASEPAEEGEADFGPLYGGIWQDQSDGGALVLAVTDRSEVDARALDSIMGDAELRIIEVPYSETEIKSFASQLKKDLDDQGLVGWMKVTNDERRILELVSPDPSAIEARLETSVPTEAYFVSLGEESVPLNTPSVTHVLNQKQPGLAIGLINTINGVGSYCGWAFNGHTSTEHHIVTAGHCGPVAWENFNGVAGGAFEIEQKPTGYQHNLTPGNTTVVSVWIDDVRDAKRAESPYADDNCYHGAGSSNYAHCAYDMRNRAQDSSWTVGSDATCSSLSASNTYRCGYILNDGAITNYILVGFNAISGDSGSGAKFSHTIDGIVANRVGPNETLVYSAYHALQDLNSMDFNCHTSAIVRTNPAAWGSCPIVAR